MTATKKESPAEGETAGLPRIDSESRPDLVRLEKGKQIYLTNRKQDLLSWSPQDPKSEIVVSRLLKVLEGKETAPEAHLLLEPS